MAFDLSSAFAARKPDTARARSAPMNWDAFSRAFLVWDPPVGTRSGDWIVVATDR